MAASKKIISGFPFPLNIEVIKASRGIGSFLSFDFTPADSEAAAPAERAYHLWIYLSDWEICEAEKRILDCDETNDEHYEEVLAKFGGSHLRDIQINLKEETVQFFFGPNLIVKLESDLEEYDRKDDLFIFFDYLRQKTLSMSPDRGISIEPFKI